MNKKDIELQDGLFEKDVFGRHASRMCGYFLRNHVLDPRVLQVVSDACVVVDGEVLVLKSRGLDLEGVEFKYVSRTLFNVGDLVGEFVELDWNMFDTEGKRMLAEYLKLSNEGEMKG